MSVVPHSLPDTLQDAAPPPGRFAIRRRNIVRECGWLLVTALASTTALALFVLVTEPYTGEPLLERMLQPINLLRLTVMTGCLGLWSYILRAAGRSADRAYPGGASAQARACREPTAVARCRG